MNSVLFIFLISMVDRCPESGSQAAAVEYAKKGARLVLAGRREDDLRHTAAMCRREGVDARVCTTDVSKKEECQELIRFTMETFGRSECYE